MSVRLGTPRLHHRVTESTNDVARALAAAGAAHGTLVTAAEQRAGRGRQGRTWSAAPGRALLMSLVLREWPPLLPIVGAVAVADIAGPAAAIKWPNDVLLDGRKLAGILAEARPQEGWAVLGIGVNVAVREADLPAELRGRAASLGLEPAAIEPTLELLLRALEARLAQPHARAPRGRTARATRCAGAASAGRAARASRTASTTPGGSSSSAPTRPAWRSMPARFICCRARSRAPPRAAEQRGPRRPRSTLDACLAVPSCCSGLPARAPQPPSSCGSPRSACRVAARSTPARCRRSRASRARRWSRRSAAWRSSPIRRRSRSPPRCSSRSRCCAAGR